MTIRKGQQWGEPGPLAADAPIVDGDRAASLLLEAAHARGEPFPEIGLTGGDLHRTLGAPRHRPDELRSGGGTRFTMDVGLVEHDGGSSIFVAHLVATEDRRERLWAERTVIVMNGSFVGELNLGPRAHPNDGRLDVTDGSLPAGQRRQGRARARTGSHVPHPDLTERRVREIELVAEHHDLRLRVDGERTGNVGRMTVRCIPDALTVVV